mmetsp:Transcript_3194/g.7681  ORF Transcript_3194/g.7681 Transcript_3194/m.7681 type:complete len:241 (-) Transcript_3194:89-811(-)
MIFTMCSSLTVNTSVVFDRRHDRSPLAWNVWKSFTKSNSSPPRQRSSTRLTTSSPWLPFSFITCSSFTTFLCFRLPRILISLSILFKFTTSSLLILVRFTATGISPSPIPACTVLKEPKPMTSPICRLCRLCVSPMMKSSCTLLCSSPPLSLKILHRDPARPVLCNPITGNLLSTCTMYKIATKRNTCLHSTCIMLLIFKSRDCKVQLFLSSLNQYQPKMSMITSPQMRLPRFPTKNRQS